eukprot:scaffold286518_cov19-Tisochrysis_lutea.AAC.1
MPSGKFEKKSGHGPFEQALFCPICSQMRSQHEGKDFISPRHQNHALNTAYLISFDFFLLHLVKGTHAAWP